MTVIQPSEDSGHVTHCPNLGSLRSRLSQGLVQIQALVSLGGGSGKHQWGGGLRGKGRCTLSGCHQASHHCGQPELHPWATLEASVEHRPLSYSQIRRRELQMYTRAPIGF